MKYSHHQGANPTLFWVLFFYLATKTNPMQFIQRICVGKNAPKSLNFKEMFFEIAIFRQHVPTCYQNIARFQNYSTFFSDL